MSARLFHYTCADHGKPGIDKSGYLRPNYQPVLDVGLVWATDLDRPFRHALGLTSRLLGCDRTAYRYEVGDTALFVPWVVFAHALPRVRREALEAAPGALPHHWWVSQEIVPVLRDRSAA